MRKINFAWGDVVITRPTVMAHYRPTWASLRRLFRWAEANRHMATNLTLIVP